MMFGFFRCVQWVTNMKDKPFLGGDKPELADVVVFGLFSSSVFCSSGF
jgi:hypothetical protein